MSTRGSSWAPDGQASRPLGVPSRTALPRAAQSNQARPDETQAPTPGPGTAKRARLTGHSRLTGPCQEGALALGHPATAKRARLSVPCQEGASDSAARASEAVDGRRTHADR